MSLEQYKDANRAELWEILQIQLEENQKLTAERDELLKNQTKRDLLSEAKGLRDLAKDIGVNDQDGAKVMFTTSELLNRANQLSKQADVGSDTFGLAIATHFTPQNRD